MAENFESENREREEDFDENRSVFRYYKNLKQIFEKYSDVDHASDVVDMETLEVITDNGDLADIVKPAKFGYSTLAITKKDSGGKIDEDEYEEFLRDPDSFISPPNLPADPLRVKTEPNEAFNKTYVVNTLKQHSTHLHQDVEEDALCRLEETLVEIIDSSSSDESLDYLSDDLESSSSSSSGDDVFLYNAKPSSAKLGDPRNNQPVWNSVRSVKCQGQWNTLIKSPRKANDKSSKSQKSPGIFDSRWSVNTKGRSGHKPGRMPDGFRPSEKQLPLTRNTPDKFEFESYCENDDEKENLLAKGLKGEQHFSNGGKSSHALTIKPLNPFQPPEIQSQKVPVNGKNPAVNVAEKVKRRITPSLIRPSPDHRTPPKVDPNSRMDISAGNQESPSVSMTKSLNCLTLDNQNTIHQLSDKPLDLSKNTLKWNSQNPHMACSEKSKPRKQGKKVVEPKRLLERFTRCYSAAHAVEESVSLLSEGSSEEMEDVSKNTSSGTSDCEVSTPDDMLSVTPIVTPVEVKGNQGSKSALYGTSDCEESTPVNTLLVTPIMTPDGVKENSDDHPAIKSVIKELPSTKPARNMDFAVPRPHVKPSAAASPRSQAHIQPNTIQRSPFTSPVAFFKVMQKKNKQSPAAAQKVPKPSATAQMVLYSSSDDSSDTKKSVDKNECQGSPKRRMARTDIQGTTAAIQKKYILSKTAQKLYSSGGSGIEAKEFTGRNDFKEPPAAYQIKLKPGIAAQKMLYSQGEGGTKGRGAETKQKLATHDHRASPKQMIVKSDFEGSPTTHQKKPKTRAAAQMLYSSGDSGSETKQSMGKRGYRASPKHSIKNGNLGSTQSQGFPSRKQVTPPHHEPKVAQAETAATTSTPTKGQNLAMMTLDISCIPTSGNTLSEGQENHGVTSIGEGPTGTILTSSESVHGNQYTERQKDTLAKRVRDSSQGSPSVKRVSEYDRDEPMEDSKSDTVEHDIRSTSDSDSDNETFTVLYSEPKMYSRFMKDKRSQLSHDKKTPTNASRQSYHSPLQNQYTKLQQDALAKRVGDGSQGYPVKRESEYGRDEPMEDSSGTIAKSDRIEHDIRSTCDSDSDNETFTVLSPQPKMYSRFMKGNHSQLRHDKKTPTNAPRQSYHSPLHKQVGEKLVQRERQNMVSGAQRSSPAARKQRLHTPKQHTHISDSDSDHSGNNSNYTPLNTPKSARSGNDELFDLQHPAKHALSEPRRFFPNKKLTPSPHRFKVKSKSVVKNSRAAKQLYSMTSSKAANAPSAQKNLCQNSHISSDWSFNKNEIAPYAKQLDVYELDSESCDSDIDELTGQRYKVFPVQRKFKAGTKPAAIILQRRGDNTNSRAKASSSSHDDNVSCLVASSSEEESDETRPLLNSRSESKSMDSSVCLGPGKCDKTFCFACV